MNTMISINADGATELAPRRPWWRLPLMLSVPLLLVAMGVWFWATGGRTVSTDNRPGGRRYHQHLAGSERADRGRRRARKSAGEGGRSAVPRRPRTLSHRARAGGSRCRQARIRVNEMSSNYVSKSADIGAMASRRSVGAGELPAPEGTARQGLYQRASFDAARAAPLRHRPNAVASAEQARRGRCWAPDRAACIPRSLPRSPRATRPRSICVVLKSGHRPMV